MRLADTTAAPVELAITDSHPSSTYIGSDPSFESTSVEEGWPHSNGSGNGSAPSVAVAPEVLERMQSGEEASTSAYVEEVVEYSRVGSSTGSRVWGSGWERGAKRRTLHEGQRPMSLC